MKKNYIFYNNLQLELKCKLGIIRIKTFLDSNSSSKSKLAENFITKHKYTPVVGNSYTFNYELKDENMYRCEVKSKNDKVCNKKIRDVFVLYDTQTDTIIYCGNHCVERLFGLDVKQMKNNNEIQKLKFNFGKYNNNLFVNILKFDIEYVNWVMTTKMYYGKKFESFQKKLKKLNTINYIKNII
jgi:hypothetical protein